MNILDQQGKNKKIWKGIKQLLCFKPKGSTLPSKLIIKEQEVTNDKAIAGQLLNKFFSEPNIKNNLASAVPKPNLPFNCYLNDHLAIQLRLRI